jgi:hypothetical protein
MRSGDTPDAETAQRQMEASVQQEGLEYLQGIWTARLIAEAIRRGHELIHEEKGEQ